MHIYTGGEHARVHVRTHTHTHPEVCGLTGRPVPADPTISIPMAPQSQPSGWYPFLSPPPFSSPLGEAHLLKQQQRE